MKAIAITDEQFTTALHAAVRRAGRDHVAAAYRYVRAERPSCLIAHTLVDCGVSVAALRECEGEDADAALRILTDGLSDRTRGAATHAQRGQDAELTWGHCADLFDLWMSADA